MEGWTRLLADFCSGLDYDSIPVHIVEKTKWAVLDNLGIIVGATGSDIGRTVTDYARALGDGAEATILGLGFQSSARTAAFVNGSLSEVLEMQDGYTKGGYHPCSGTISASLAVAEWRKSSGKDLLTAVVAGYEFGNRVSAAMNPTHLGRGFQPTGTVGSAAAAAAVARLLGTDNETMLNAIGIAAFLLPISTSDNHFGGYTVKPLHGGAAARTGIESVLLAQRGLNAAPLEGDPKIQKGFCRIMTDEPPHFEKAVEGLGKNYTIEEVYFKPYAACRINHGPVEVALDMKRRYALRPEDIDAILVSTYEFAANSTGAIKTDTRSTVITCQLSMSYGIAAALIYGELGFDQISSEKIGDSKIHALASKVRVVADQQMQKMVPEFRPAVVEVTLKSGRRISAGVDYPKGDYRKPMADAELLSKYLGLTRHVLGEKKARAAADLVLNLDRLDSVDELVSNLHSG